MKYRNIFQTYIYIIALRAISLRKSNSASLFWDDQPNLGFSSTIPFLLI